jgi:hypothetical protein
LNEFESRNLEINDFDYPSKKGKDGVSMDEASFIIYFSPRDAVQSRGVRKLVGKSVEVLKIPNYTLFVQIVLIRVPARLVRGKS